MLAARPDPETEDDDDAVVARVVAGDVSAFRVLVERHEQAVFRVVRALGPRLGTYEDVAQDVFVAAFAALGTFDASRGRFGTWLLTIAKNRARNARRKMQPLLMGELPAAVETTTPADALAHAEARRRLDAAFETLPEDQRTAFVLEAFVGLGADEIAAMEGVAAGTIRSRVSRARAHLRAALADGVEGETSGRERG